MSNPIAIAKPLAPEDLAEGASVAVLSFITEHLPFSALCGSDEPWQRRAVVRTRWLPTREVGAPLRIARVCLPFVLVEKPDGSFETLDTRRVQLGLLSDEFARKAGKRLRQGAADPARGRS